MPSSNWTIECLEPFIFQLPMTSGPLIVGTEKVGNGSQFGQG